MLTEFLSPPPPPPFPTSISGPSSIIRQSPTPSGDYVTLMKAAVTAEISVSAIKLYPVK